MGYHLAINPVHNIRKHSSPSGGKRPRKKSYSSWSCCVHTNPMLAWIVRIALETGMRSSEITISAAQVDLKRVVFLLETKNTMPNRSAFSPGVRILLAGD